MAVNACTIIARNYLPYARVLARSFTDHHPQGQVTALILDDLDREVNSNTEPFEVMHLEDLFDIRELHTMAMIYDVMELATAVKPFLLRHLLANGNPEVIYLDPDIEVFAPLDFVLPLARKHGIVLTPHITSPLPRDGKWPTEAAILASGVFNLGFVAVGTSSGPFLDYWSERLRTDCIVDIENMLFVDQRWVDFAPGCFSPYVLRDPAVNVAYWNLDHRKLSWSGTAYEVNGEPLKFFHFSGYSPKEPHLLSRHQAHLPRILLSEHPSVAQICGHYDARLQEEGFGDPSLGSYGYAILPSGIKITQPMRRLYRQRLLDAEAGTRVRPPDPFAPVEAEEFISWLNEPHPSFPRASGLTRYLIALRESDPGLRAAFGDLYSTGATDFLAWARAGSGQTWGLHPRLVPEAPGTSMRPGTSHTTGSSVGQPASKDRKGVNVAGYFRAQHGVGEGARLLVAAIEAAGLPYSIIDEDAGLVRQGHNFTGHKTSQEMFDTNILCINADMTQSFALRMGQDFFEHRYTIGVWAWELEDLPPTMHPAFHYVDEVWAVSNFTRGAIAKISPRPVFTVPHGVVAPSPASGVDFAEFGIPDGRFVYLFSFDLLSGFERKNPLGVLDAFEQAFKPDEGPLLVLKVMGSEHRAVDLERLKLRARDRSDVVIIERAMPQGENAALMARADCFVSLHRSEGFGLSLAESMALGKPVIATAYSGNLDFMDRENSFLVPYSPCAVPAGCEPYPSGMLWANPITSEAARLMRLVYENPELAAAKGRMARESILSTHSIEVRARFISKRLEKIWETRERSITRSPATLPLGSSSAITPELVDPLLKAASEAPSATTAAQLALRSPDIGSPARFAGPARLLRRTVLRMLRHHDAHQRLVDVTIARVLEAHDEHARQADEAANETTAQLEQMKLRLAAVEHLVGNLGARVNIASQRAGQAVAVRSASTGADGPDSTEGPNASLCATDQEPDAGPGGRGSASKILTPSSSWPDGIARDWPSGHALLVSAFGEDGVGGLFACTGDSLERLDCRPSTGLYLADRIAGQGDEKSSSARLLRLLHAPDGPNGVAELLVYDSEGLVSHLRLDEVHDPHDVSMEGNDYVVVSTFDNEVVWLSTSGKVKKRWRAPGEPDSWHLNSLAWTRSGELLVSAFGQNERYREWARATGAAKGVLFSPTENKVVLGGFESPHTPTQTTDNEAQKWFLCSSAAGQVLSVDLATSRVDRTLEFGGWTRGLALCGSTLLVGVSSHRQRSGSAAVARVVAVDQLTGEQVGALPLPAKEIYDLLFVPEALLEGLRAASSASSSVLWVREATTSRRQAQTVVASEGYRESEAEDLLCREQPRGLGPLPEHEVRISIKVGHLPDQSLDQLEPGALRTIEVEIRNLGRAPLSSRGSNPVRISYRWEPVLAGAQARVDLRNTTGQPAANGSVTQDGAHEAVSMGTVEVDLDGSRSFRMPLSRVLLAGEKIRLRALLRAPDQPAQYRLIVTAVQEGVRWFDQVSASNAWSAIVNVVEDDSSTETKSINKPRRIDANVANSRHTGDGNSEASGQRTLAGRSPATHDDATRSTTLT